jgi:hypothetical protein
VIGVWPVTGGCDLRSGVDRCGGSDRRRSAVNILLVLQQFSIQNKHPVQCTELYNFDSLSVKHLL